MKGVQAYQQSYPERTLACSLTPSDFSIFQNNLLILKNVKNNIMPELIADSKLYLQNDWGMTNEDLEELKMEYIQHVQLHFPRKVYFNGQPAPQNCNLEPISSSTSGPYANMSPIYRTSGENTLPITLDSNLEEAFTIAAAAGIETRVNKPENLDYIIEFPGLQPFYTPPPIDTSETIISTQSDMDLATVGNCAMQAIGLDILFDLREAVAGNAGKLSKNLAKSVFKKAIKKVAAYATGAGVGIAVVAFGWCLLTD